MEDTNQVKEKVLTKLNHIVEEMKAWIEIEVLDIQNASAAVAAAAAAEVVVHVRPMELDG